MPRHRILHTAVLATGLAVSQVAAALPTQLEGSSGGGIYPGPCWTAAPPQHLLPSSTVAISPTPPWRRTRPCLIASNCLMHDSA